MGGGGSNCWWGLDHFLFFTTSIFIIAVFSGGECFYLILYIVFLFYFVNSWGGCKSRHFTVYHMSKTWLQEVHGGRETWGVTVK